MIDTEYIVFQVGYVVFVDLHRGEMRLELDVNECITGLDLVHSDHMTFTFLLVINGSI